MTDATLHNVSPIFQVSNLQRGIDFYTQVMGFELAGTWGTPPDRAALYRDSVQITLEVERSPRPSDVYVQVKGIDDYYARIVGAGARVRVALADRAHGVRHCRVRDPDGNGIALGESVTIGESSRD